MDLMTSTFLVDEYGQLAAITAVGSNFGSRGSTADSLRDGPKWRIRDAYLGVKERKRSDVESVAWIVDGVGRRVA